MLVSTDAQNWFASGPSQISLINYQILNRTPPLNSIAPI